MGGVPLGEVYETLTEDQAQATLQASWTSSIRYFDTSPWYGRGLSELRFGTFLRQQSRDDFVLSSKVGRTFHRPTGPRRAETDFWAGGLPFQERFDYTYDGIMRSYEQSLMRLGLNRIDLLLIHDLDVAEIGSADLVAHHLNDLRQSGWRALENLRHNGDIRGIGAGVNILGTIPAFLELFDLDFFLVAMPYTLLDQAVLDSEFPLCEQRGVGVVVGSPYASGILATGPTPDARYNYEPATSHIRDRTERIERLCRDFGVPLKAAALQFPLLHPVVASVVSGSASAEQARENTELMQLDVPVDLWRELRKASLVHELTPVP